MREMKPSGISWIGSIPSSWKLKKIKYAMISRTEDNNPVVTTDILSLTAKQGVVPLSDREGGGNKPKENFAAYRLAYPGDIVMNSMNILSGSVGLSQYFGCVSPVYYMLRPADENDDVRFYHYIFQTKVFQKSLRGLGNGILIKESGTGMLNTIRMRIPIDKLGNLYLAIPDYASQAQISDYLDFNCAEIDKLTRDIQIQIDTMEEYKKSVITEAVTKGLNTNVELKYSDVFYMAPYNSSWHLSKIGYVCSKLWRPFETGDTALLCTNKGKVTLRPPEMLGKMVSEDNAMQGIHKGDIAIHGMDTWHGAIALSEHDGKITRVVHVCDSTQDKRFIVYYLQQLAFNGVYKLISNGVRGNTSDFRSWDKVKNIYIALPPIAEQCKIADYLDRKCAEVDAVIKDKQEMLSTLAEYKKSMIYEYVTGKKEIPAVKDDVVVLFDPNALWLGCIVDKLGKEQRGRTQIQKIKYLLDVHCGINPNNQYYRYNHGPYDINLNDHLGSLVGKRWFKQEHGKTITLTEGECHADFQNICKERIGDKEPVIDGFLSLLQSMKVMKTSRLERIATLYAVWNDFLLDGITPTDDQIIQEVLSNWTENKAHSQYETWQDSLNKMKKHGLIPKGTGLHTLPKPEKDGGEAE